MDSYSWDSLLWGCCGCSWSSLTSVICLMLACPPLEVNKYLTLVKIFSCHPVLRDRSILLVRNLLSRRRSVLPSLLLERYVGLLLLLRFLILPPWLEIVFGDLIIFIQSHGAFSHSRRDPSLLEVIPGSVIGADVGVSDSDYVMVFPPLELLQGRHLLQRLILCIAYSFGWFRR